MNYNYKSFIRNNFEAKEEPKTFEDITRESRESLDPANIKKLVEQAREAVLKDPGILEDIWIQTEGKEDKGIDREQIKVLLKILGSENYETEIDSILREADFDGDGNIDAEEFKKVISFFM